MKTRQNEGHARIQYFSFASHIVDCGVYITSSLSFLVSPPFFFLSQYLFEWIGKEESELGKKLVSSWGGGLGKEEKKLRKATKKIWRPFRRSHIRRQAGRQAGWPNHRPHRLKSSHLAEHSGEIYLCLGKHAAFHEEEEEAQSPFKGGGCFFPSSCVWPDGRVMTHILSYLLTRNFLCSWPAIIQHS